LGRLARRLGFGNISLDLIAGLPHQTATSWLHTLQTAAHLEPEHISLYLFEIDAKSRLGREVLSSGTRYNASAVPSEDFMAEAYEVGREFLAREGYKQYEISNFAMPGYESRHNRKYWQLAPYVGLGAGAHSFDGQHRWANQTEPRLYEEMLAANRSPLAEIISLSPDEQLEEFFFLGLRQSEGVDLSLARQWWGADRLARRQERIDTLLTEGLLEHNGDWIRLTERAYLVSNEIFQEFVTA
jgi:oxygen-independent coproporphyrinogen-3 oxidase